MDRQTVEKLTALGERIKRRVRMLNIGDDLDRVDTGDNAHNLRELGRIAGMLTSAVSHAESEMLIGFIEEMD